MLDTQDIQNIGDHAFGRTIFGASNGFRGSKKGWIDEDMIGSFYLPPYLELFPGQPLFCLKNIIVNNTPVIKFSIHLFAKEQNSSRSVSGYGSGLVIKEFLPDSTLIVSVLEDLASQVAAYIQNDRFTQSIDGISFNDSVRFEDLIKSGFKRVDTQDNKIISNEIRDLIPQNQDTPFIVFDKDFGAAEFFKEGMENLWLNQFTEIYGTYNEEIISNAFNNSATNPFSFLSAEQLEERTREWDRQIQLQKQAEAERILKEKERNIIQNIDELRTELDDKIKKNITQIYHYPSLTAKLEAYSQLTTYLQGNIQGIDQQLEQNSQSKASAPKDSDSQYITSALGSSQDHTSDSSSNTDQTDRSHTHIDPQDPLPSSQRRNSKRETPKATVLDQVQSDQNRQNKGKNRSASNPTKRKPLTSQTTGQVVPESEGNEMDTHQIGRFRKVLRRIWSFFGSLFFLQILLAASMVIGGFYIWKYKDVIFDPNFYQKSPSSRTQGSSSQQKTTANQIPKFNQMKYRDEEELIQEAMVYRNELIIIGDDYHNYELSELNDFIEELKDIPNERRLYQDLLDIKNDYRSWGRSLDKLYKYEVTVRNVQKGTSVEYLVKKAKNKLPSDKQFDTSVSLEEIIQWAEDVNGSKISGGKMKNSEGSYTIYLPILNKEI